MPRRHKDLAILLLALCATAGMAMAQPAPLTAYTLPPEKLAKAVALARIHTGLHFAYALWSIASLVMLLVLRIPARLRNWAGRISGNFWVQCLLFAPVFFLFISLLTLPLEIFGHHVSLAYGLSIQQWPSWFGDVAKSAAINMAAGTLLALLIFFCIRRSPERWWLWLWVASVPVMLCGVFLTPLLIDPIFNHFEPLQQTNPALVAQLERVVQRAGVTIPPERIFLMRASDKVTAVNAYVTGIGASKRVVVWDTSIQHATPNEISFVFAHELGHYVLNHVPLGMAFTTVLLFAVFWIGRRAVYALLRRFGTRWQISSHADLAALAVLLLVVAIADPLTEPVANAFSRTIEHNADVFGQEAVRGIVPDPNATATQSFQILGELNLDTPEERPFIEFWTYSHPSIQNRLRFAATYDPWAEGAQPKYFKK